MKTKWLSCLQDINQYSLYLSLLHTRIYQLAQENQLELGEILEAEPIPFTFDTLGWKIVFVFLLLIIAYVFYKLYLKYKSNQYRRDAVAEMEILKANQEISESSFITQSVVILKRIALLTYKREDVASLQGENWLRFLDGKVSNINFTKYTKEIENAVYQDISDPSSDFNKDEFFTMSIKWIKNHA